MAPRAPRSRAHRSGRSSPGKPTVKPNSKPSGPVAEEPEVSSGAGEPEQAGVGSIISKFRDVFSGGVGGTLGKISSILGPAAAGYGVMTALDSGTQALIEHLTGNNERRFRIAEEGLQNERLARKEILDYYKGESKYARDTEENERNFEQSGTAMQRGMGLKGAINAGDDEVLSRTLTELRGTQQVPRDIMGPIMQGIAEAQRAGTPINPLLLMGINV